MNNITMLMASVLMTEQVSSPNLLNLSVNQLDKNIHNQSYQIISQAKAASPKAMRLSHNLRIVPLALKSKVQKSKIKKIREIFTKDIDKLTKLNSTQELKNDLSKRKSLTSQRRDKLVFTRSQKTSFINRQNLLALLTEQNTNDIVVASSQSFNHQKLPHLSFNSSGVSVRVLQRLLVANGYAVKVDGSFGALTESAVKAFQEQQDLTADGIVGTQTWYCLTACSKQQRHFS